jgi:hypothetical protein
VGQRQDGFVVNLGETFDLVNIKYPVTQLAPAGSNGRNLAPNSLAGYNVTSIALEVPVACLTAGNDPVIGAWTTASLRQATVLNPKPQSPYSAGSVGAVATGATGAAVQGGAWSEVSRLGMPLVNELVIGLPDKDKFNASLPANDAGSFLNYVTNPTLPALIELLFGTKAPTAFPRADLVAVFLTGVQGLNQSANLSVPGEELRLNTSIAPVAKGAQNRLGVIAGDNAGFPNGRRPGDDVVDIELRAAMGVLYTAGLFGKPSDAPSGALEFTDGACVTSAMFDATFPYLTTPIPGSPQAATEAASTGGLPANPGACK